MSGDVRHGTQKPNTVAEVTLRDALSLPSYSFSHTHFFESMPHNLRTLHTNQKTHTQWAKPLNSPAK